MATTKALLPMVTAGADVVEDDDLDLDETAEESILSGERAEGEAD